MKNERDNATNRTDLTDSEEKAKLVQIATEIVKEMPAPSDAQLFVEAIHLDDKATLVNMLKEDARFSEIVVLGHSEGSLIGILAAQQTEADKFISVAGAGSNAADILRTQLKAQPPAISEPGLAIIDGLAAGNMVEDVPPILASAFRASVQPYIIS